MDATHSTLFHCGGCSVARELGLRGLTIDVAAMLHNVGWRQGPDGRPRCPTCVEHGDGVIARHVWASDGHTQYRLALEDGKWVCSCRGHRTHKHCKHADAETVVDRRRTAAALPVVAVPLAANDNVHLSPRYVEALRRCQEPHDPREDSAREQDLRDAKWGRPSTGGAS